MSEVFQALQVPSRITYWEVGCMWGKLLLHVNRCCGSSGTGGYPAHRVQADVQGGHGRGAAGGGGGPQASAPRAAGVGRVGGGAVTRGAGWGWGHAGGTGGLMESGRGLDHRQGLQADEACGLQGSSEAGQVTAEGLPQDLRRQGVCMCGKSRRAAMLRLRGL